MENGLFGKKDLMSEGVMFVRDARVEKLAKTLVEYSCDLKPKEKILIEVFGTDGELDLAKALIRTAYGVGGYPHVQINDRSVLRELYQGLSPEHIDDIARFELERMKEMDAYIGLRGGRNVNELSDVPDDKMRLYMTRYNEVVHTRERVNHTKWVVLRYPTPSMAQLANMSTSAFEDFYFDVCTMDYARMDRATQPLKELMERTDTVRIKGPGTDLTFSIKGIPVRISSGRRNIPDGEVFTAPVRNSVNGTLTYNTPSVYQGVTFENIQFTFKDGKIIEASANHTERLNQILDSDEGARYIGEFSLGINPYILHPMKDTLFDEKITGSFHFTPGSAYEDCDNGNRSAIHWDLVNIQRPEYGGGDIYFDDVLIRKDGLFVIPELEQLNPDQLK